MDKRKNIGNNKFEKIGILHFLISGTKFGNTVNQKRQLTKRDVHIPDAK